jgi:hypothetical protein
MLADLSVNALIDGEGHVRSVIVKRPGYGTLGRILTVNTNAYQITIPDTIIRHYDGMSSVFKSLASVNSYYFRTVGEYQIL